MSGAPGTRVCAVGEFTSGLAVPYLEHTAAALSTADSEGGERSASGRSKETISQLKQAFNEANLPLSLNQVTQLLQSAIQSRDLLVVSPGKVEDHGCQHPPPLGLSWGEFSVCCVEAHSLLNQHRNLATKERLRSPASGFAKGGHEHRFTNRGLHPKRLSCRSEVFLGGSCNPTTWRKEVAIPLLKKHSITFFNPQVDEWYPELIEIEEQAKSDASLLLFVVDNQTRAVSSMVEIAYFAGLGREMIVVVDDITGPAPCVGGDALSEREAADLNRGRAFIRHYLESGSSVIEVSVETAVQAAAKVLRDSLTVSAYSQSSRPLQLAQGVELGDELCLIRQVFMMYDHERAGTLTVQEAEVALKSLHVEVPSLFSVLELKGVIKSCDQSPDRSHDLLSHFKQNGISFEDFCTLYAEIKYGQVTSKWRWPVFSGVNYLLSQISWIGSQFWSRPVARSPASDAPPPFCDVFLGGSCGETTWREKIALPILRQHGVSYFNPQLPHWDVRMVPIEREAKERCSVLLFVICGDTLSVASMVEVSYYLGQGRNMVLCLSDIPYPTRPADAVDVEGMKLSERAVKDYNRGRAYLSSIANKCRVQIFNNINDAVLSAVYMVKGRQATHRYDGRVPLSGTSV